MEGICLWAESPSGRLSYLDIRPQYFCQVETTVDGKRFVTPRGWEDLSQLITVYEHLDKRADREVVGSISSIRRLQRILPITWNCIINIRMSIR